MTPLTVTEIEGRKIPTSWRIAIPKMALPIERTAECQKLDGHELSLLGRPDSASAGSHSGVGYLEMTGLLALAVFAGRGKDEEPPVRYAADGLLAVVPANAVTHTAAAGQMEPNARRAPPPMSALCVMACAR